MSLPAGYSLYAPVLERLEAVREASNGITARCPVAANHRNGDANPSLRLWIGGKGELVAKCMSCGARWQEIASELGTPPGAWFPDGARTMDDAADRPKSKIVAEYPYKDRDGNLLAVKTRWEPGFHAGRSKDFTWKRPLPADVRRTLGIPDGVEAYAKSLAAASFTAGVMVRGAWMFDVAKDGKPPQFDLPQLTVDLYRMDEVVKSATTRPNEPVFVVEGEKVTHTLLDLGFIATTGPAGMGKWCHWWGSEFKDRRVVIIPDQDPNDAALEYSHKIAGSVMYYGVRSVRLVALPIRELKPDSKGGDLAHWLAFGDRRNWSRDQRRAGVIDLCKGFPEWTTELRRAA